MALARADRILSFANSCYFPVLFARSSDRETIILQTGIMALLPCVSEVKENFKQVQGKKFRGYYVGTHYIDQTDSYLGHGGNQQWKIYRVTRCHFKGNTHSNVEDWFGPGLQGQKPVSFMNAIACLQTRLSTRTVMT